MEPKAGKFGLVARFRWTGPDKEVGTEVRRSLALGALVALLVAGIAPAATNAAPRSIFALAGEARALDIALFDQGVTLGLALARGDSTPSVKGVAAGACTLLGNEADPTALPCDEANTELTELGGILGDDSPTCTSVIPPPLSTLVSLDTACGLSKSGIDTAGMPWTKNKGTVAELAVKLSITALLPVGDDVADETVDQVVDTVTDTLAPVLDALPQEVGNAVENVINTVENISETKILAIELGTSQSDITPNGDEITVSSMAAGARIGILGIPGVTDAGSVLSGSADPLENGLIIIEVGAARASATVNDALGTATSTASPALLSIKVRDITSLEPKYVEIAIAPGQTITLLAGTPLESTITAADSTTSNSADGATAAADAVRLHLLKGVNGGLKVGLGRAVAAANAAPRAPIAPPAPGVNPVPPAKRPPVALPVTGGTDYTGLAIMLALGSVGALVLRRRFSASSN